MFDIIKKYEGCELKAYKCPAGVWTIGWGTTIYPDGKSVQEGDTCTQNEADSLLLWYCTTYIKLPKGKFSDNQKQALYSLIYNIGQTAFDKSDLKKEIELQHWGKAFKNWDWISADGKEQKGLIKRRVEEMALFFGDIR